MKYTITINQAGISEFGFADKTDFTDWAILSVLSDLEAAPRSQRMGDMVWMNYKLIMTELPLSGIKSKSVLSGRIEKLRALKLIETEQTEDTRLFAKTTELYSKASSFKVAERSQNQTGVLESEQGVLESEQGVLESEQGVLESEHSTVYKTSTQEQYFFSSSLSGQEKSEPKPENLNPEQQAVFDFVCETGNEKLPDGKINVLFNPFWKNKITERMNSRGVSVIAAFLYFYTTSAALKNQYAEFQAKKYRANAANTSTANFNNGYATGGNYAPNNKIVQFSQQRRQENGGYQREVQYVPVGRAYRNLEKQVN